MREGRDTPTAIRLLILSSSRDRTEIIEASLRNGGLAVHCTRIPNMDALEESLRSQGGDLLLCCAFDPTINLHRTLETASEQGQDDLPVLVLFDADADPAELLRAMHEGVRDLIDKDDLERLRLVVDREIGDLQRRRELATLRLRLQESEQRCQDLIEGSREAIAFFQDGMHVQVNPAYLQMLGFQNRADVEDLSLLDIVDKAHHKAVRAALKELEAAPEHHSVTLNATCRRQDGSAAAFGLSISKGSIEGEPSLQLILRDKGPSARDLEQKIQQRSYADTDTARLNPPPFQEISPALSQPEKASKDAGILELLDKALHHDRFLLVYQPIVSLQGDSQENYAVMVRMLDEHNEELLPKVFISLAEQHGKMVEIDHWVIRHAIAALSALRQQGNKINFFIILSDAILLDDSLIPLVCDCLREYDARGNWLTFQIHEQCARDNLQAVVDLIDRLKKIKCQIALDHFGLLPKPDVLLDRLNVDYVKLDPSFVRKINNNQQKQDELNGLNEMAVRHKVRMIATAVENADSLAVLWTVGIAYIQGGFLQKPSSTIEYGGQQVTRA